MRTEAQKSGFFSRATSLLTHNWWLKLLALLLAIIVYHSLKPEGTKIRNQNDRNLFEYR